jgi:hypothetical protein
VQNDAWVLDGTAFQQRAADFLPERFFEGRTEGGGLVRDVFGRVQRRCTVVTEGVWNEAKHAIQLEESYAYDDGEVDIWRWVMTPTREGHYVAAEAKVGTGVNGWRDGLDYVLRFRRPVGKAAGPLAPSFHTRFTPVTADLVVKVARVSLYGLPLGSLTAVHRRVCP